MTLLLLAGTGLAQDIARRLDDRKADVIVSLAGRSRTAAAAGGHDVRIGGFGGDTGFRAYLAERGVSAVLDATHPFAARISDRSARICAELGLPYALVQRPPWVPQAGDLWQMIEREEEAARHIAPGSTVFLATGRQTLERFANLGTCELICRQIDPPDRAFPFENGRFLVGTPPFSVAQERELFAELKVDWLVVKNAGGAASATKLTAARELGLRVAMIERPALPDAPVMQSADAALDWVAAL